MRYTLRELPRSTSSACRHASSADPVAWYLAMDQVTASEPSRINNSKATSQDSLQPMINLTLIPKRPLLWKQSLSIIRKKTDQWQEKGLKTEKHWDALARLCFQAVCVWNCAFSWDLDSSLDWDGVGRNWPSSVALRSYSPSYLVQKDLVRIVIVDKPVITQL